MNVSNEVSTTFKFQRLASSHFVENPRGFRQHYLDWPNLDGEAYGETSIPIILLHPKRSNARHWDFLVDALSIPNRVVAADARGHGLSDWPDSGYTVPELGLDVISFMDAIEIERTVLIGGATGGNLCVSLAAQYPDRVAGITVIDPGMSVPKEMAKEVIRQTREEHDFSDFEAAKTAMHFQDLWRPEVRDHYAAHSFRERSDGRWQWRYAAAPARSIAASLDDDSVWGFADQIKCPALLVRGATSTVFTEQHMARLSGLVPHARIVHLEDAEHTPAQENPEGLAENIDLLIASL
jgi:pimeloyl-ACP methyl ester carboxylesterase